MNPRTLTLSQELGQLLLAKQWRIATVESCTGGGLSYAITAIPGSSAWFEQGFITYSNDAKVTLLNLEQTLLYQYGAVSKEVVESMATQAQAITQSETSLAVSGIAGPGGGSQDKPVGTVWLGSCVKNKVVSQVHHFKGDRHQVRSSAIEHSLRLLIGELS